MSFALKLLALHPQVQDTLFSEIQQICPNSPPEYTDLNKIPYALCIMYETMRLFPVIGSLNLSVSSPHDETLLGKYPIPKDVSIGIDLYCLHRNENYWGPTANEFDPSRWDYRTPTPGWYSTDGKTQMPVRGAWWGFSEGPRSCLGIPPPKMVFVITRSVFVGLGTDFRASICGNRVFDVSCDGGAAMENRVEGGLELGTWLEGIG